MKEAVTVLVSLMVTVQVAVPEHAPLQPVKVEPVEGAAVRVTIVPGGYDSLQSIPQSIPSGELMIEPLPVPVFETVNTVDAKVAVTVFEPSMVTWQVPVPVQAPLQPVKNEPAAGAAVSTTTVPEV